MAPPGGDEGRAVLVPDEGALAGGEVGGGEDWGMLVGGLMGKGEWVRLPFWERM